MDTWAVNNILSAIYRERYRQEQLKREGKFRFTCSDVDPSFSTADRFSILGEEIGEVAREVVELRHGETLRKELIEVAAVAVAWIEAIDKVIGDV